MLTTTPKVSVVLPLYNDAATIAEVLASLDRQEDAPLFEVIVVDDGSTDDAPRLAAAAGARVISQANAGPAAARNCGADASAGTIVLFLDSDCVAPSNWVSVMSSAIDGARFQAAMGTLRAANDGIIPRLVQIEIEDRYRGMSAASIGVDFIAAPSCGFLRKVFVDLGGFDTRLRQAEDVEMGYRFTAAGHSIAFVDAAPVAHAHQTGWGDFILTKYRRAVGRLRVFQIHPEKRRHDNWTPLALKVQFVAISLSLPLLVLGLLGYGIAGIAGLGFLGAGLILGGPLILAAARRERALVGLAGGLAVGAAFVIIRSFVILAALLRTRFELGSTMSPPVQETGR
jgi:glycosyltransferase involved in cell wall biosynthesis